jgi:hypothetical protein
MGGSVAHNDGAADPNTEMVPVQPAGLVRDRVTPASVAEAQMTGYCVKGVTDDA